MVIGPRGKMGKLIVQEAARRDDMTLVGGIAPKGRDYVGADLGQVAGLGKELGKQVYDDLKTVIESCDVIIDFSTRETSLKVLETACLYKKSLVCGTTGFSEEEKEKFICASEKIPVLYAANTSKMVHVLKYLLETAVRLLPEADIEILEMHDQWKVDAPSGTSRELGEAVAKIRGEDWKNVAVFGREGVSPREKGTIGYHSLRAGNIPSSHTVFLGGMGERIEISHHSYNWECFARGACDCAAFLKGKQKGYYTVEDVIGRSEM